MSEVQTAKTSKALILGVGGTGARVLRRVKNNLTADFVTTAVIDTDMSSFNDHPADKLFSASADWILRDGAGCGGDVIRGERALARERAGITDLLRGYDLIIVTAGLGGGTATGGLRTVASVIRGLGIPSVFLLTLPFSFESFSRRKNANVCVSELLPVTDILLTLPNDLLFSRIPPDSPAAETFALAEEELSRTVLGIAAVLRCRDLIGSDYAVFMSALRGHCCACGVGTGLAEPTEGIDRSSLALERMLESPFLGGMDYLKESDAVMMILSGSNDLSLAEMKRTMEQAGALLPPQTQVLLGAAVSPDEQKSLRLTAIAIHYKDPEPREGFHTKSHTSAKSKKRHAEEVPGELIQTELGLTSFSRGVFDRYPAVKYRDQDLDIPAFQRKELNIDKGS